jgi:hypothetical protein
MWYNGDIEGVYDVTKTSLPNMLMPGAMVMSHGYCALGSV